MALMDSCDSFYLIGDSISKTGYMLESSLPAITLCWEMNFSDLRATLLTRPKFSEGFGENLSVLVLSLTSSFVGVRYLPPT
jgi:hypothetical protein